MTIIKATPLKAFKFRMKHEGREYVAEAELLRPGGLPTVVSLLCCDDGGVAPGAFAAAERRALEIWQTMEGGRHQ